MARMFNFSTFVALACNGGNKARLAYADLSSYHRTLQPNGLYCVLSAAFFSIEIKLKN